MVPRMSAPASTTTSVGLFAFQLALCAEMENDSGAVNPLGRIASGSCDCSPIMIVVGPASSLRVTIFGFAPNTFSKSEATSWVACWIGAGSLGSRRMVTAGPMVIELPLASLDDDGCAEADVPTTVKTARSAITPLTQQRCLFLSDILCNLLTVNFRQANSIERVFP